MPTPNTGFVIVGRQIKTEFAEDTYPVAEDVDLLGGFQVQPSLTAINAIPMARRKPYMQAVDGSTGIIYQYIPNPAAPPNYIWSPFAVYPLPQVVASATGAQTPNFLFSRFEYTLTGNITVANATNVTPGQTKVMQFRQDATGSRTVTWGAAYDAVGLTLASGANTYTIAQVYCDSAGVIHIRGS